MVDSTVADTTMDSSMKIAVFGLTVSSSWGNGHATLWRGLLKALAEQGVEVTFFEHDEAYYAAYRDWHSLPNGELVIYEDWPHVQARAESELDDTDVAIVTSYCPDAIAATQSILDSGRPLTVFYDLDTPVTLSRWKSGEPVAYIGPNGLRDFDLVLSYTGGEALRELQQLLGAQRVQPLYGHVDPQLHCPVPPAARYRADLSYLGTYAADRQGTLQSLFIAPAQRRPERKFLLAGAQYPQDFPWTTNLYFVHHLPPGEHAEFFCSSRLTLNVTRQAMAQMGWCPSGRLFEAAACGAAVLSDPWPGIDHFYTPGNEILLARDAEEALAALELEDAELQRIATAARERTLDEHTSVHRAQTLLDLLDDLYSPGPSLMLSPSTSIRRR
jgi:spore maturation protein CgeB